MINTLKHDSKEYEAKLAQGRREGYGRDTRMEPRMDPRMDPRMEPRKDVPESYVDSEPLDYRAVPTASGGYYIPTPVAPRGDSPGAAPSRPSQRGEENSSRDQEYFLPGEDINREVVQADICRYLGNDATVRPYQHPDGRQGYIIRSYRAPTSVSSVQ
jgi:hypothetical protein